MDEETIEKVKTELKKIEGETGISLNQVIVFGSRAREDYTKNSDIDIMMISEDFKEIKSAERPKEFYLKWDYDKLPEPEFICYTPSEYQKNKKTTGFIAKTATENGIKIA